MTILVTGATGTVGRELVRELVDAGQQVRALTRTPAKAEFPAGVEVVAGDLADISSLDGVFDGVTALHLIPFGGDDYAQLTTVPEILELAAKAGVTRVTVLWGGFVGPVEKAVQDSGLEWTIIQPMEFMSNVLTWKESIRAEGVAREPFGDVRSAAVHPADIAAVTAKALTEDGHHGKGYDLTGPEALSMPEKVRILSEATGKDLRFVELTKDQARERMYANGVSAENADFVLGWHENPPVEAYTISPVVEQVTGRPARTFRQWATENADAFRSA